MVPINNICITHACIHVHVHVYIYTHIYIYIYRDISCCYGDRDLLSVCHGCVEEGQYVQRSSLLRIEGDAEPDQTDQGTLKTIGGFQSPNNIQRCVYMID